MNEIAIQQFANKHIYIYAHLFGIWSERSKHIGLCVDVASEKSKKKKHKIKNPDKVYTYAMKKEGRKIAGTEIGFILFPPCGNISLVHYFSCSCSFSLLTFPHAIRIQKHTHSHAHTSEAEQS